jgi:hypothetical protein
VVVVVGLFALDGDLLWGFTSSRQRGEQLLVRERNKVARLISKILVVVIFVKQTFLIVCQYCNPCAAIDLF